MSMSAAFLNNGQHTILILDSDFMDKEGECYELFEDKGCVVIKISTKTYSLSIVKRAAYFYTRRCNIDIQAEDSIIKVKIEPKDKNEDLVGISKDFLNELLRTNVEYEQSERHRRLREAIFREALNDDSANTQKYL